MGHLFVIQTDNRDSLASELKEAGVQTLIHYPIAPHLQRAYGDLRIAKGSFPIAERLADRVLSLPMGPHLSSEQAERVARIVAAAA